MLILSENISMCEYTEKTERSCHSKEDRRRDEKTYDFILTPSINYL